MVARYDHTYQQGLNRLWSRKDKFDYYWPVFANIGEQAIKLSLIHILRHSERPDDYEKADRLREIVTALLSMREEWRHANGPGN